MEIIEITAFAVICASCGFCLGVYLVSGKYRDKIEGLSSDLDNAVETAFKRGAEEWTKLNYPLHYERFKGKANGNQ